LARNLESNRERLLMGAALGLEPLVRALSERGVAANDVTQLVKWLFVKAARDKLKGSNTRASISRIAAASGLTRAEVGHLLKRESPPEQTRPWQMQRSQRVIIGWCSDPDYLEFNGQPRALPFAGPSPSFSALAARYSGDIPPRAILGELIDSGRVVDVNGLYELAGDSQRPRTTTLDIDTLGATLRLVGNTICHNASSGEHNQRYLTTVSLEQVPPAARARIVRELNRRCRIFAAAVQRYLMDEGSELADTHSTSKHELGLVIALFEDDRKVGDHNE
jgi:hypothetical protein